MKISPFSINRALFLIAVAIFLCSLKPLIAEEFLVSHSIFIPVLQDLDFEKEKIVDINEGDITVVAYGIDASSPQVEIAQLEEGFIEDLTSLPRDEVIEWTNFADYKIGMIYAVKRANQTYALFELIDIKVSGYQVLGIEIDYKYQPDGSKNFN